MTIGQWLTRGAIALRLGADSKRQVLGALADVASKPLGRPASALFEALLSREAEGSTGVGGGVALPHARIAGLQGMNAAFIRLDTPVAYGAVDGRPVDLLLALFAPEGADAEHLRALARTARMFRRKGFCDDLRGARTADAIYTLLAHDAAAAEG